MSDEADIQRTLGHIEGTLTAITDRLERQDTHNVNIFTKVDELGQGQAVLLERGARNEERLTRVETKAQELLTAKQRATGVLGGIRWSVWVVWTGGTVLILGGGALWLNYLKAT